MASQDTAAEGVVGASAVASTTSTSVSTKAGGAVTATPSSGSSSSSRSSSSPVRPAVPTSSTLSMQEPAAAFPGPPAASPRGTVMRGSPGAPEEILRALEEENVVLRTECDIHQVELASASHLIQTLDDEALTLRKRIKELEPMEERAQKVVEENVKLKATLQRQKVTIRKMMGETYDSDEDDISVENLKEEMLQLQEKLAETSARKEELLAENERLLALAGGEQDDFPEGTSNAANAKTGSVSSTKAAERTAETLKKRVEELEASLRNSEETSKLLTETEEEIEQISNQISEVENKNLQLHKELQLRLETEENLREKLRRLGHDQHEHGDGADDAVEVLGIKEAGDSGNGKDLPGIDILKRTSSSSASRGRSRSKHRRSRSSSSGRGSSISSGIGRLTDDEHFICEAAPGADAAIEIVKVKENKMAPEVSARSRKMQIDTVHHVAISLAPSSTPTASATFSSCTSGTQTDLLDSSHQNNEDQDKRRSCKGSTTASSDNTAPATAFAPSPPAPSKEEFQSGASEVSTAAFSSSQSSRVGSPVEEADDHEGDHDAQQQRKRMQEVKTQLDDERRKAQKQERKYHQIIKDSLKNQTVLEDELRDLQQETAAQLLKLRQELRKSRAAGAGGSGAPNTSSSSSSSATSEMLTPGGTTTSESASAAPPPNIPTKIGGQPTSLILPHVQLPRPTTGVHLLSSAHTNKNSVPAGAPCRSVACTSTQFADLLGEMGMASLKRSLLAGPDDDLLLKELRAVAEVASGEVEKEPGVARIEDLRRRYEVLQRTQGRLMQSHAVELAKLNRNNEHLRGLLLKTCRKYGVRKKDLADLCAPFNEGVQKIGVDVDAGSTGLGNGAGGAPSHQARVEEKMNLKGPPATMSMEVA